MIFQQQCFEVRPRLRGPSQPESLGGLSGSVHDSLAPQPGPGPRRSIITGTYGWLIWQWWAAAARRPSPGPAERVLSSRWMKRAPGGRAHRHSLGWPGDCSLGRSRRKGANILRPRSSRDNKSIQRKRWREQACARAGVRFRHLFWAHCGWSSLSNGWGCPSDFKLEPEPETESGSNKYASRHSTVLMAAALLCMLAWAAGCLQLQVQLPVQPAWDHQALKKPLLFLLISANIPVCVKWLLSSATTEKAAETGISKTSMIMSIDCDWPPSSSRKLWWPSKSGWICWDCFVNLLGLYQVPLINLS